MGIQATATIAEALQCGDLLLHELIHLVDHLPSTQSNGRRAAQPCSASECAYAIQDCYWAEGRGLPGFAGASLDHLGPAVPLVLLDQS